MKVIIDIPQDHKRVIDNLVSDGKEYLLPQEVETRLARAVKIGVVIPDNATNGDMIKAMFPNEEIIESDGACVYVGAKKRFDKDYWNAPYKKGEEE